MPNWKKVIVSGSDATLNSITTPAGTINSITASYAMTASYSNNLQISGSINNVDYIDFNTGSATPAWKSGRVFWNNTDGALSVYNAEADVTLQVGQENWTRVRNNTGTTITNGTAVRLNGAQGDVPTVERAQSLAVSGSINLQNQILGLATHDIEHNSFGYVTTQGLVRGVNTSAFNDGDTLFVGTGSSGVIQNVPPRAPYEIIPIGVCVKAGPGGSGIIYVAVQQPYDFSDLSSVLVSGSYNYGDLWTYVSSGSFGVWTHTNQLSGSYAVTGSWSATSFTGSLLGTASFASTASFVNPLRQTVIVTGSLAVTGSTSLIGSSTSTTGTYTFVATASGDGGIRIDNTINGYTSINWLSNSMGFGLMAGGGIFAKVSNGAGLHIGQSPNSTYLAPLAVTSHGTTTGTTFLARNSAGTNILKVVDNGRVGINNANPTASLDVAGTTRISGSFNTAASGSVLIVQGSGSAQPIFTVQGSQGELFSITDSLSGSLFSVNDISGLPVLEAFSDNTVLIGNYQDPMLITTTKLVTTASGQFTLYTLPTASYDTAFFEYSIKSGSNARAGSIMAIQSGTSVNFTETTTTDFGSTAGFNFTVQVAGANMILTGSATTSGWTIKTIVRSI